MIYRRLSKDWDYTFGNGTSNYIKGAEAVAQAIKSRLLLLYGEWWEEPGRWVAAVAENLGLFWPAGKSVGR